MFCQKCGKQIYDDSKFCGYCGARNVFCDEKEETASEIMSFCVDCRIYSEGEYCKNCGKNKKENGARFHKNVIAFFVGLTILISSVLSFLSSIFTIISDLSKDDYWEEGYTYTYPLTDHEKSVLFFVFAGIVGIFVGVVTVAINKPEAVYMNKAYEPIAYVAYAVTVIAILCSLVSIIPYFSVCDRCQGLSFGKSYSDVFDEYNFCYKCYEDYWD